MNLKRRPSKGKTRLWAQVGSKLTWPIMDSLILLTTVNQTLSSIRKSNPRTTQALTLWTTMETLREECPLEEMAWLWRFQVLTIIVYRTLSMRGPPRKSILLSTRWVRFWDLLILIKYKNLTWLSNSKKVSKTRMRKSMETWAQYKSWMVAFQSLKFIWNLSTQISQRYLQLNNPKRQTMKEILQFMLIIIATRLP